MIFNIYIFLLPRLNNCSFRVTKKGDYKGSSFSILGMNRTFPSSIIISTRSSFPFFLFFTCFLVACLASSSVKGLIVKTVKVLSIVFFFVSPTSVSPTREDVSREVLIRHFNVWSDSSASVRLKKKMIFYDTAFHILLGPYLLTVPVRDTPGGFLSEFPSKTNISEWN